MLIIDTLGYRRFKITPDPIELEKNPDLEVQFFEAEPYILAKGDQIKLEFHLFQNLNNPPVTPEPAYTGGMGSQDNLGTPGIVLPKIDEETGIPNTSGSWKPEELAELQHHHKTILIYELNYLDIMLNGFKDWLSLDACIQELYAELKPINPDNYLISDIIKQLSGLVKQSTIETLLFTPTIKISSEYTDNFDFIYSKAQGVCHKNQNHVSVFIEIEATLNILVQDPEYTTPADVIRIGNLPYKASTILNQTFDTKPFIGYSPIPHTLHAIIESGANTIQIVKTATNNAPGIKEARWGLDIASDRIKFIININYLID